MTMILLKPIVYFGQAVLLFCDSRCDLAWGKQWRGERTYPAPEDPGTAEGPDSKPKLPEHRLNRWCARECERSEIIRRSDGDLCEINLEAWKWKWQAGGAE